MADNMNMIELGIKDIISDIMISLEDEDYDPALILGPTGVGKTESITDACKKAGIGYKEFRLVHMSEIDLIGLPKEDEFGRTTHAACAELPNEQVDGEVGILVLDEITSATPAVRAAAYQLLDSKRSLGTYHLPPKWKVVALGNGPDDGGVFRGMEYAFLSRATCYRVRIDLDAWKTWATNCKVNPTIVAFLSANPEYLHKFDPDEPATLIPCPRTWVKASKKLNSFEKRANGILEDDVVERCTAVCVGMEASSRFCAFYKYRRSSIDVEEIFKGNAKMTFEGVQSEVVQIAIQQLVYSMKEELSNKYVKGKPFSDEEIARVVNVCRWCVAVGDSSKGGRLDWGSMALSDLASASSEFRDLVVLDEYDQIFSVFPELDDFFTRTRIKLV